MTKKTKLLPFVSFLLLLSATVGVLLSNVSLSSTYGAEPNAVCQGIANDENNNIYETVQQLNPVPRYRTLLKYDVSLGNSANETNVALTTGKGIKLNGVPLSDIQYSLVDYANGSKYIRIKIPASYQDNLGDRATLEVEEGTVFENKILDGAKFSLTNGKWNKVNDVTFTGIQWNDIGYNFYKDMKGVLLGFSGNLSKTQSEIDGGIQSKDFSATVGEHIYLGGNKLSSLPGAFVSYHSQNFLFIYAKDMSSYRTLEIEKGTIFLDASLPNLKLNYDVSNKWSTNEKSYTSVTFNNIQWNDTGYNFYKDMKGVLLGFSGNLSKIQSEIDGGIQYIDYSTTIGDHILLGDYKLSSLPGAFVSYHSQNFLFIYAENMPAYRTLKIEAGTKILDASLPSLTLYYTTKDKWSTEPEPLSPLSFSSIFWNNVGYDVYEGKNGLMLSYSDNLSNANSEIHGGIKLVNHAKSSIGNHIKLDGVPFKDINGAEIMYFGSSFLWIYAPNMTASKELVVESVEFLTCILPETHFSFFSSWSEIYKINNIIDGVERIQYCKKNTKVTLGEDYYSSLLNGEGLLLRLISFEVNGTTYTKGQTLEVSDNVTVNVIAVGFETTKGASIRISDTSNIRFENKIDSDTYDYLINKYHQSNIETGTYIFPRSSLSLSSVEEFLNDKTKKEGVDYFKSVNNTLVKESSFYKYYGSLSGVFSEEYCTEYCGVGYIKIKDGENVYTVYGNDKTDNFSRSVYDVIKSAYKDYSPGTYKHNELTRYLDTILSLVDSPNGMVIDNTIEGYTSPYSVQFDASTGEYTVSGNAEIKTILINGEVTTKGGSVVNIGELTYKTTNFVLKTEEGHSMLKFKLTAVSKASNMVDFVVNFPSDREMKILQITDTQIIDSSQMRKPDRLGEGAIKLYAKGNVDKNCFNYISALVENEQPDLILFTGDIVYGEFDDSGVIWMRMIEFMDSLGVPWAPIFGNHDNETYMGVDWQCQQLENAQNCLFKQGDLTGNGNYSIGLVDSNGKIRRVIYMLDSNGCLKGAGVGQDQIDWMENVSSTIDGAYDEKIPSFVCMHIPSVDFKTAFKEKYQYSEDESFNLDKTGLEGDFGQKNEKVSSFSSSLITTFKNINADGVFAGHDHVNNYSIEYDGIRYTYGTKTGIYDYFSSSILGGTLIRVNMEGDFEVSHSYLKQSDMENRRASSTAITFLSDLHFDTRDYGGFYCTKSKAKLSKIISETQGSRFYINLGDTINSCEGSLKNYYDAVNVMKSLDLNIYNSKGTGYVSGNRMIYNLLGNHEAAYADKDEYKDYAPYVDGVGSTAVFKYEDIMFVAVDAIFTRSGSDDPSDIITCTEFSIPNKEIDWLKNEIKTQMDSQTKGIVWISHVALQDIDSTSKQKLLDELKSYDLPMTVFEGHTHIEKDYDLIDQKTGLAYCHVYTLPAVTLYNTYPYYNVIFKDGKPWVVDKHTTGEIK